MLEKVVLLPSALGKSLPNDQAYGICLFFLKDILQSGMILVGPANQVRSEIFEIIHDWPPKFRKQAQALLSALAKRNRFVKVQPGYVAFNTCQPSSCQHGVGIAKSHSPSAIVMSTSCMSCNLAISPECEIVDISSYYFSDLSERLRKTSIVIPGGKWTQQEFESKILEPLFCSAKHVKIIDRHMFLKQQDGIQCSAASGISFIRDNYLPTLEMLLNSFSKYHRNDIKRKFEVISSVDCEGQDQINTIVSEMKKLETKWAANKNFDFSLNIKKETSARKMIHARYIVTDQFCILVERGFDLLWSNGQMRDKGLNHKTDPRLVKDVTLSNVTDAGTIEKEVQTLSQIS